MWEKFKKRVANFIFEYEEFEEDESKQTVSHQKENLDGEKKQQHVKTRMAFEYPKNDSPAFRFPLIPDGNQNVKHIQSTEEKRVNYPSSTNKPAYIRRKNRPRRKHYRTNVHSRSVYEKKKFVKELEDVPAFVRRRQKRKEEDEHIETNLDSNVNDKIDDSAINHDYKSYSRPDELDAVFKRKKYGNQLDYQKEHKQDYHSVERYHTYDSESDDDIDIAHSSNASPNDNFTKKQSEGKTSLSNQFYNKNETEAIKDHCFNDNESVNTLQDSQRNDNVDEAVTGTNQIGEREHYKKNIREHKTERTSEPVQPEQVVESIAIPRHLLDDAIEGEVTDSGWLREQKRLLNQTLEHFNINAQIVAVTQGPTVTRIEIQPALGVKVSRIRNLADDIKLNLAARDIRIEAPIPGKHTVGIEIPNESPQMVHLQEMIESEAFQQSTAPLTIALGLTIEGEPFITDISKMPHGLIAGATGSGKSVCINTIILSLLYKAHFDDVKLMLIDPKMVELTQYNGIPHLLTPVITDAKAATAALKWAVDEMERRYELFVNHQVRNIKRYNRKLSDDKLPYIVIIIDELADLMLVSPQEVEDYISRIAQKARAAGIHLILATQRPSVDVITGLIKANIPSRIAFAVSSQVDSRTILDTNGAEKLLGKGDMLFIENGTNKHLRLQGPFVSDEEIDRVVAYLRTVAEVQYLFEHEQLFLQLENEEEDDLFDDVVQFVIEEGRASTSMLQRRFRIGYNRAARLIDSMYEQGIISAQNGSKPRDVLITRTQWDNLN